MKVSDILQVKQIEKECDLSSWSVEDYKNELTKENSATLVLENQGEILGFLVARLIKFHQSSNKMDINLTQFEYEAEIYNFAIKLKHQKKGLGQKLLGEFLEICCNKNVTEIWLEVRQSNKKAFDFYYRNGFEMVYLRKDFYSSPKENGLVLKRKIRQ